MELRPFEYQTFRRLRQVAGYDLQVLNAAPVNPHSDVKVWWRMIVPEHLNENAVKSANGRHYIALRESSASVSGAIILILCRFVVAYLRNACGRERPQYKRQRPTHCPVNYG